MLIRKCLDCDKQLNSKTAYFHRRRGHRVVFIDTDTGEMFEGFRGGVRPISYQDSQQNNRRQQGRTFGLVEIGITKPAPTVFVIGQDKVALYPEDLLRCYDEYRDLKAEAGWNSDFSSTIREGMRLLRALMIEYSKGGEK